MDDDAALLSILRGLAADGFGTVLGLRPGAAPGLRRVGRDRATPPGFLEEIYREQRAAMVRYAARLLPGGPDAEDAVQRAFEKVLRRDPDPGELDNPVAYVVTATRNEINRALRRVVTERARTADPGPEPDAVPDVAARVEDRLAVRDALTALSAREREAVVLRLQYDLSLEEAAAVMGVSPGSVKGYTHHGVRKLRDRLSAA